MRIFITGATGFIGKHVVDRLKPNNELLLLTRRTVEGENCVIGNLSDIDMLKDTIKQFQPEAIIHIAWEGIPDYAYDMSKNNLVYGLNILDLCKYVGCKTILFTGSCWEYEQPCGEIREDHELSYANAFKVCKNSLNQLATVFCAENNIKMYWTRFFYVYGPGQKLNSLIPSIILSLKKGETPNLLSPLNKNDFVYVKFVAKSIEFILKNKPENIIFNIGSGESTAIVDILRIVTKQLSVDIDFDKYKANEGQPIDFYASLENLDKLGIECEYSLADGIKETIEYLNY